MKVNREAAKQALWTVFENRHILTDPIDFAVAVGRFVDELAKWSVSTPEARDADRWYRENRDYVDRLNGGRVPHP